jgi:hypothetical protein
MITITGLTHKQKVFMDVMWCMESMPAVNAFINSLPTRDRQDCQSLVEIAVQETLEQEGRINDYEDVAVSIIARARSS